MADKKKTTKKKEDYTKPTAKEKRNPQHIPSTIKVINKRKLALQNI